MGLGATSTGRGRGLAVCLVLLLVASAGCLPASYDVSDGKRPDRFLGRDLRVGAATQSQVIDVLGRPSLMSKDGRWLYVFRVQTGRYVQVGTRHGLLIDRPKTVEVDQHATRYLTLRFDGETLESHETYKTLKDAAAAGDAPEKLSLPPEYVDAGARVTASGAGRALKADVPSREAHWAPPPSEVEP